MVLSLYSIKDYLMFCGSIVNFGSNSNSEYWASNFVFGFVSKCLCVIILSIFSTVVFVVGVDCTWGGGECVPELVCSNSSRASGGNIACSEVRFNDRLGKADHNEIYSRKIVLEICAFHIAISPCNVSIWNA